MYFFQSLYFCSFWWFTQARNLRTSTSLIAYGARGVKNWLFSHWVLYRQMGHLWMEETYRPPFSAFKDSLIAYFILPFFPKRHPWSKARLHANAFFYDIFEERTLGLSILSLSFWEWKKFLFFVTFATHIWRLKRSLECYHFSGRQLSYKCFGHTRLSSFCSFLCNSAAAGAIKGENFRKSQRGGLVQL